MIESIAYGVERDRGAGKGETARTMNAGRMRTSGVATIVRRRHARSFHAGDVAEDSREITRWRGSCSSCEALKTCGTTKVEPPPDEPDFRSLTSDEVFGTAPRDAAEERRCSHAVLFDSCSGDAA